jgi:UDP-N-acetyl-D-galactosamine dehydrogenase
MGLAFKENCPDIRNTRIVDIVHELAEYNIAVDICDPWVDDQEARHEYKIGLTDAPAPGTYDAIVLAVAHDEFRAMGAEKIRALGKPEHVLYDLKYLLERDQSDIRL